MQAYNLAGRDIDTKHQFTNVILLNQLKLFNQLKRLNQLRLDAYASYPLVLCVCLRSPRPIGYCDV